MSLFLQQSRQCQFLHGPPPVAASGSLSKDASKDCEETITYSCMAVWGQSAGCLGPVFACVPSTAATHFFLAEELAALADSAWEAVVADQPARAAAFLARRCLDADNPQV